LKKTHSVVIEKIVNGALGLARLEDGRVVLVDKVLPGEEVAITIRQDKKQYLYGEVFAIEKAHPARIDAPCPWYGRCGGCDLQHCSYDLQLQLKSEIVEDLFRRQFPETASGYSVPIRATRPSPALFGYRQRIRLQVDRDGKPGFTGPRSHTIVPILSCLVAPDQLNTVLAELRRDADAAKILHNCREVELLVNPISSGVVCLFHLRRRPRPADIRQAEDLVAAAARIEGIFFTGDNFALTGPIGQTAKNCAYSLQMQVKPFGEKGPAIGLGWEVGGFCQVNLEQNERLIHHVLSLCDPQKSESVLDLFCGMGNFSIPLAMRAGTLVGFEGQGSAIRSARKNSEAAGLGNTNFHKAPIHEACRELAGQKKVFDYLVLDPPRQGVPGLAGEIASLTGRKMVYISCDPATLCRDLEAICRHGLTITHIQPFDMFPQTHHIETVVLLEKN
jgi:23S rRNA (uracil1939-C5)-methyltransferase